MQKITQFEKVSLKEYAGTWEKLGRDVHGDSTDGYSQEIIDEYESIRLPERATWGSAGYDFFLPRRTHFYVNSAKVFPTGIRCKMDGDVFLALLPKSGLGTKYGFRLLNTVGVVDADYYNSDNEGHIQACITTTRDLVLNAGDKYMQGIFLKYEITVDDMTTAFRNGGFGSTGA